MTTLLDPRIDSLLGELMAAADTNDEAHIERAFQETDVLDGTADAARLASLLAGAAMPVSREVGRLLYSLVRATRATTVVEFGTSFGISTIHLAAAVIDNGTGRVIGSELDAAKVDRARINLERAGVAEVVDIVVGDARQTLTSQAPEGIQLVLLDGWKDLYLPVLQILEPKLAPLCLVIADDLKLAPDQLAGYLDHVRQPTNGWLSVELPVDDGLELSMWLGRDLHAAP